MTTLDRLKFSNAYSGLSSRFYSQQQPTPFTSNHLVSVNPAVMALLGLDDDLVKDNLFLDVFSGKTLLKGMDPVAMLYSGHQFGTYVPQLGDGRAILLGELETESARWELQLKGAGQTPYSRNGDGRAVLRSTIREYLCSEAMHALNIPTTRALCITATDDEVYREQIEPGAILTRVAQCHVRFGSFEYFYYTSQEDALRELADFVIAHYYPQFEQTTGKYAALLEEVVRRTALLIAQWQTVGFAHGVMNSDNMSILGLTLDYGPFGFLDDYNPDFICNHSDHSGRYAFDNQPGIGLFNLSCFAQAILPLLDNEPQQATEIAKQKLDLYQTEFINHYAKLARAKLGLMDSHPQDQALYSDLLNLMAQDHVDFTRLFRSLCHYPATQQDTSTRDLFINREAFDRWAQRYADRLELENSHQAQRQQRMKAVNPKYILRNYLAETAIQKAQQEKDYSEIDKLLSILQRPFDEQPENERYAADPPDWAKQISVSCSS